MTAEKKIQVKAIKAAETGNMNIMAGRTGGTVLITQGHYIVYMLEKDCMLDLSKIKQFPEEGLERYSPENLEKQLKEAESTNRLMYRNGKRLRLFVSGDSERIWVNEKYAGMFRGSIFHSVRMREGYSALACTRYGNIRGLILPVKVLEEEENG